MFHPLDPAAGVAVAALASVAVGTPFLKTTVARRALTAFAGGPDGEDAVAAGALYAGLVTAYAGVVVLAGESAANAGPAGLTLTLLLPFGFGVAAACAWLPSAGVEWRPPGEARTDATLSFTAFLATVTVTAAGGWLLAC